MKNFNREQLLRFGECLAIDHLGYEDASQQYEELEKMLKLHPTVGEAHEPFFTDLKSDLLVRELTALARLYDVRHKNGLEAYLNAVEINAGVFDPKFTKQQVLGQVKSDRAELQSLRIECNTLNLKEVRDEILSHNGEKYIRDNIDILGSYPVNMIKDAPRLSELAGRISLRYYLWLTGRLWRHNGERKRSQRQTMRLVIELLEAKQ